MAPDGLLHEGAPLGGPADHHDEMGPPQRAERLPEGPPREEVAVSPRRLAGDEHHLQVLLERPVLEGVIQHEGSDAEALQAITPRLIPVFTHDDGNAGEPAGQEERLVARALRVRSESPSIRHDLDAARATPLTPA